MIMIIMIMSSGQKPSFVSFAFVRIKKNRVIFRSEIRSSEITVF